MLVGYYVAIHCAVFAGNDDIALRADVYEQFNAVATFLATSGEIRTT